MPDETYRNLYPRIGEHHFVRRGHSGTWGEHKYVGAGSVEMMKKREGLHPPPPRQSLLDDLFPRCSEDRNGGGGNYVEAIHWNAHGILMLGQRSYHWTMVSPDIMAIF